MAASGVTGAPRAYILIAVGQASEELTALIRHAHGYAWRRRMNRQLGVVLGEDRDTLRTRPGLCDQLASLAGRIQYDHAPTETLVRRLCRAAEHTGTVAAERIAGRLALHVADPAVAGVGPVGAMWDGPRIAERLGAAPAAA